MLLILPELSLLVDPHVFWVLQTQPGQIFDRLGLSGREQKSLTCSWEVFHNSIECVGESHVKNPIGLIQNCRHKINTFY